MVPPFKSLPGTVLQHNETQFNALLAKPRVKSEHCIGILKGHFPFLRSIWQTIGNKKHMDGVIDSVRGTVVLHNFLVGEDIDSTWIDNNDEGSDNLDPEKSSGPSNKPDHSGRSKLFFHLREPEETSLN